MRGFYTFRPRPPRGLWPLPDSSQSAQPAGSLSPRCDFLHSFRFTVFRTHHGWHLELHGDLSPARMRGIRSPNATRKAPIPPFFVLSLLSTPPLTAANAPLISFCKPTTNPPKLEELCVLLPHRHLMRAGTPVLPAFAGLIVAHDQVTHAVHGVSEPQAVQEA